MEKNVLQKLLENGPVFLDGATGSNLMKAGRPMGSCAETWILEHPQVLKQLQQSYVEAGSHILLAPTFTANRHYLSQYGLQDRLEEVNAKLVALTRSVCGSALVAGDMTTLGNAELPYGQLLDVYSEQAKALEQAGVDLFVIETMMGLEETMAALEACKMASEKPVICSFSVMGDGMLYFGGSIYDAAPQLEGFGAAAVGINCSSGPDQMATVIRSLARSLQIPVLAKPNAGMPVIDETGTAQYSMDAETFARHMNTLRASGAALLGGCCGTEPDHIAAMVRACS
jgi:5-methyltetrahydrofolate--homocysteine methyltransferase